MEGTQGPTTEQQTQASVAVVVGCSDGEVAMSETEFQQLLDAGNVLHSLVYGHSEMRSEANFDVFKRFNVSRRVLNAIRLCIRENGRSPPDSALDLASSAIREYADALGGFPLVDAALQDREAKRNEELTERQRRQRESAQVTTPLMDRDGVYEWGQIMHYNGSQNVEGFNEMWKVGFSWVSCEMTAGNGHIIHRFRRPKDSAQGR
uniref:Uncharacterized protein n=1 Tax=Chromera velia CCMP2878 TaxID=1169474 RepID=A0A0G4HDD0_9ALVE|eukprot:Cvel_26330.t1-p1 / transcript=Cvel_26330.t1 / gene=Cvel_26330 / organism=Chromera_velia_CCMP2878 / gene_product=hypothetical protein / transcript_product=hypothetical protein / location=Cvel_scaffold3114:15877-16491(-) / protein_length=205 / sequence_SO=supercontig / SO=protein_coding / is_pseudo=false